ncbi:MAG: ATP-binding cassette domain-containing protein [Flavobacteriia bacterium]|nr:ATP-binding cassette domain-containing protein [Flavobacteriia bacterium]
MLRPKREKKTEKVKLSKESIQQAKKIFQYLKPYQISFLIGWIFLILSTGMGLLFPVLMGKLLGGSTTQSVSPSNLQWINLNNINNVALALFILFALQAIFSFFRVIIFTKVTENVLRDIKTHAFSRLIYMPMDFFNQQKVGELSSRISADITQIQETLRTTIAEFFRQIIIVLGGILFLFFLSWKLAFLMLATVPVMSIIAVFFGRYIRKLSKIAQDEMAASNVIVEESLNGITNVKAFTNEVWLIGRYRTHLNSIFQLNIKSGLWRGVFASFIIFCIFGAIVFVIWQGLLLTQGKNPELSMEDFYSFIFFTIMMGASVGSLPELFAGIQKAVGATDQLMRIIGNNSEKELMKGTQKPLINGSVEFNNVHFSYPQRSDINVLKGLSFSAKPNQTIALVGSSGAGKTTIASLILRFYDTTNGKILINETDINDIDVEFLRSHMAYVPQEVLLFAGSIRENILYGNKTADENQLKDVALKANCLEFIEKFPEGFDTQVGDRGIQLSGGQKQRIAIARALLKNPKILILDEATSALDSESEKSVKQALDNLMKERTSFVIAHRLSTIKKADLILVLEQGIIVESGTHYELLKNEKGLYSKLIKLQNLE